MKTLTLSIIIAGAVIAFVTIGLAIILTPNAIFCSSHEPQLGAQRRVDSVKITGLEENYLKNEPIMMYVEWNGVWERGYVPSVTIRDVNGTEVWHQPTDVMNTKNMGLECGNFGFMPTNSVGFLSLNKTGKYTVSATVGDKTVQKEFAILPILMPNNSISSQTVTLTGDNAWKICSALQIPCPSNPSFQAKLVQDYYFVVFTINGVDYDITLNKTSTCVSLATNGTGRCVSGGIEG